MSKAKKIPKWIEFLHVISALKACDAWTSEMEQMWQKEMKI